MASMFQNFMQGMGSLDDRQRAILLSLAGAASPNPKMAANLGNTSQGLLQGIQAEADRKQREQEAEAARQARMEELRVRMAETTAQREDTSAYRESLKADREAEAERTSAFREAEKRRQAEYNTERLEILRSQAEAVAEAKKIEAEQKKQRERMAREAEARKDFAFAARLRGVSIPDNPFGGMMGSGIGGMPMPDAPPTYTLEELIEAGSRPGTPPRG